MFSEEDFECEYPSFPEHSLSFVELRKESQKAKKAKPKKIPADKQ